MSSWVVRLHARNAAVNMTGDAGRDAQIIPAGKISVDAVRERMTFRVLTTNR